MSSNSSHSYQVWLNQVTQPYVYGSTVANDIDQTLRVFHELRPQSRIYNMANTGASVTLINLIGTIPVASKQNSNRIIDVPLEICLPLNYPTDLPLIWVRPPPDSTQVVLKPTDNCDSNGLVWGLEAFVSCSLVDLLQLLQQIFEEQLPIATIISMPPLHQQSVPISNSIRIDSPRSTTTSSAALLFSKISSAMEIKLKECNADLQRVLDDGMRINEGEAALKREILMLNNEISLVNKEVCFLQNKQAEMERLILEGVATQGSFVSKNPIVTSNAMSSQLLELLANESALMDALYALIKVTVTPVSGESRIPLTSSLRSIRELSRRHFLTKTHIRKIVK